MATKTKTAAAEEFLTIGQVADRTGVSVATISRACTSGELACVRFGVRALRIPSSALEEFVRRGGVAFKASPRARKARKQPQRG